MFDDLKIEKNIPLPQGRGGKTSLWKYIADTLEIGDSIFIEKPPRDKKGNINIASRMYTYKPKKFVIRPEKEGARIWRKA